MGKIQDNGGGSRRSRTEGDRGGIGESKKRGQAEMKAVRNEGSEEENEEKCKPRC